MSKYADIYLLPIKAENVADYRKIAQKAGKVFIKHGALKYREFVASDMEATGVVPFPKNLKLREGETVIFAIVEFRSESHRKSTMKKIFADPDLAPPKDKPMPFDYKRMVYGGFKILVDL